jgi:hypothetical protein
MVIHFFCKTHSYGKRETFQSDFLIGSGAQLAYQAIPKILDEELSPSVIQNCSFVIHKPQNGVTSIYGLRYASP